MLTDTLKTLSEKLNFATVPVSKKRQILMDIHGAHCFYCGDTPEYYEIDHVHPKSRGGDDTLNNMVLSCVRCNQTKGGCGINNMNDQPRWLKEAVLRTLRLLYPYSGRKFSYTPSGRYHLNGDAPIFTPKITEITEFGQLIERHRIARQLTKNGVLKRLNCFEKKWNNYLTRKTIFGESQLPTLSELLSIPMPVLLKAYISDLFAYALERETLSQVWKKDFLQQFIETCDIENRWRAFLDKTEIEIKRTHPLHGMSNRLKIGRPPGKIGRDRIKKETGFEVFPTEKIQAFQKELKYQSPPIEKVSIPTRIEKASIPTRVEKTSIPTRIEKAPIPPLRPNPPKPGPTPEERAAIRQRKSRNMRAKAVLNADLSNCRTEFGKALRTARIEKEMSQRELAKEIGVSTQYITVLEIGSSSPYVLTAYRLKRALGLPEAVMPPIDVSMCPTAQGKVLREYRIKEGLTIREFAEQLGIHYITYTTYETKAVTPRPENQKKLEAILKSYQETQVSSREADAHVSDPLSARDARIVKTYTDGASQMEIRRREKIGQRTLKKILTDAGVPIRSMGKQRALIGSRKSPGPKHPPRPRVYPRDDKWSEPEDALLRKMGSVETLEAIQRALPRHRTLTAIKVRRKRLKIPSPNRTGIHVKRTRRAWQDVEIKILEEMVAAGKTDEQIQKRLRHRTAAGIAKKRNDLHLTARVPRLNPKCPKMVAQCVKLKMAGFTHQQIAEMFEVYQTAVANFFKKIGLSFPKTKRKKHDYKLWTETETTLLRESLKKYWHNQPLDTHITYREMVRHVASEFPHRTQYSLNQKVKSLTYYWYLQRDAAKPGRQPESRAETPVARPMPPFREKTQHLFSECERQLLQGGSDIEIAENLRVSEEFVRRHRRFINVTYTDRFRRIPASAEKTEANHPKAI